MKSSATLQKTKVCSDQLVLKMNSQFLEHNGISTKSLIDQLFDPVLLT
jgi:hypothetical protein